MCVLLIGTAVSVITSLKIILPACSQLGSVACGGGLAISRSFGLIFILETCISYKLKQSSNEYDIKINTQAVDTLVQYSGWCRLQT